MSDTPLTHSDNQEPTAFTQAQLEWLPWLPPLPEDELTDRHCAGLVDAARAKSPYFRLLARDPDVILGGSNAELSAWQAWPQLHAVRRGQVWAVPDKGLERPSRQMLGAIEQLCERMAVAR